MTDEHRPISGAFSASPRRTRTPWMWVALPLALLLALSGVWACGWAGAAPRALGVPVAADLAVPLAQVLASDAGSREVVVSGRVAEVCSSSGCWLILREVEGERVHELFVDLSRQADFTVSRDLIGSDVCVVGTLVAGESNVELHARGLLRP